MDVRTLLLVVLLGTLAQSSVGQVVLRAHSQPHIHALGQATVAERGYQGAVDINPATIGTRETGSVGGNFGPGSKPFFAHDWELFSEELWISSSSASVKTGRWAGALQLKYFSLGEIELRDSRGRSLETFDTYEWTLTTAGAYDVTDAFTVGGGVKLIRLNLGVDDFEETTGAVDVGLHYQPSYTTEEVRVRPALGWSLSNFGPTVDYGRDQERPLPMTMRLGGGVDFATTQTWHRRPVFQLGVYGAFSRRLFNVRGGDPDGPFRTLFSSGWTSRERSGLGGEERISVWEQTIRHAGVDVTMFDVFSLQVGRFHQTDAAGGSQYTGYGFGVDLYYLELEHSWTGAEDNVVDNSFWRVTAHIPLQRGDPRNFWPTLLN